MFGSIVDDLRGNLPRGAIGWVTLAAIPIGFVAAWIILRKLLPGRRAVHALVLAVPAVAIAWWVGSPLFIDERVEEDLPSAVVATDSTAGGATETTGLVEPTAVARGALRGINHSARGDVVLYRTGPTTYVVRFEDVDIQNGPDLFVYLAPRENQEADDGIVNLGALKGNQGSQNYEIPAGTDPSKFKTVLVWCRQFAVPFANATLAAA